MKQNRWNSFSRCETASCFLTITSSQGKLKGKMDVKIGSCPNSMVTFSRLNICAIVMLKANSSILLKYLQVLADFRVRLLLEQDVFLFLVRKRIFLFDKKFCFQLVAFPECCQTRTRTNPDWVAKTSIFTECNLDSRSCPGGLHCSLWSRLQADRKTGLETFLWITNTTKATPVACG